MPIGIWSSNTYFYWSYARNYVYHFKTSCHRFYFNDCSMLKLPLRMLPRVLPSLAFIVISYMKMSKDRESKYYFRMLLPFILFNIRSILLLTNTFDSSFFLLSLLSRNRLYFIIYTFWNKRIKNRIEIFYRNIMEFLWLITVYIATFMAV